MKEYDFEVIIVNKKCDGCITIKGTDEVDASQKALNYVSAKLYDALPELDIEFNVKLIEDNTHNEVVDYSIKRDEKILTKEEAVKRHRELWNKIAELIKTNGLEEYDYEVIKIKVSALRILGYNPYDIDECCWCCKYNNEHRFLGCKGCPIKWSTGQCSESEFGEFFDAVEDEENEQLSYNIAIKIANLPEREDDEL